MIDAARLRVTLQDLAPAPWREIEVPLSMSFQNLHDAIQAAFLWEDHHLWTFDYDGKQYGIPFDDDDWGGPKTYKASNAKLTKLREADIGEAFLYTYDMGDCWEHQIEIKKLFEAESGARLPRFIDGKHRAPPEDCGGAPGFDMFLEAISDPSHPEHDEVREWYGGPFNADDIEENSIRAHFGSLAKRRPRKA